MLLSLLLAFLPMASTPEAEGVSSRQLMKWIDACERDIDCLHGFVFLRHGKVIAEGSWKPFDTLNETHFLSSHSKCFTSTAVGLLVDEGKMDLDERVVDIIPDKVPANASPGLQFLRVRDLMTMNFGASDGDGWKNDQDGDWIKAILSCKVDRNPGTVFQYDSGATHLLGYLVERRCGKPLMDFLRERFFSRVGIDKVWTTYDPQGHACAGWGMNMTTREIATMGQLHLNGGIWNGERILSENWVSLATTRQTWSGKVPTPPNDKCDWHYGFGFNWWGCRHNCYRADGAAGQFTFVMKEHDAVLSINADVNDMQKVMDVVWDNFLPVFAKEPLPEDRTAADELRRRCASLSLPPLAGEGDGADVFFGRDFKFKEAPCGIRAVRLNREKDQWTLKFTTVAGAYDLPVGRGEWKHGELRFSNRKHQPLGDTIGVQRVVASGAAKKDGSVDVRINLLSGTRRIDLNFTTMLTKPIVKGNMVSCGKFKSELW